MADLVRNTISPRWRVWLLAYAPVVFWVGVIFYLSSDQGSMSSTSRFFGPLLHFLFPGAPEETIRVYHGYIRKFAHFAAYAVLAILTARAILAHPSQSLKSKWVFASIGFVFMIATLDELNQSFSNNRTGSPSDVLLDLFGGACAIFAFHFVHGRIQRKY